MIDLSKQASIEMIIAEINSTENKARKYDSFSKWDVYSGNLTPYVNGYLKKFYNSDSLNEVPVISSVNLCKRIVDTEASLYKQAPIRTFVGMSDEQVKVVEQIYQDMMFNARMLRVNQAYKLNNQVHAQVVLKDGMLHLRSLMGHHLDAIPNVEWPEVSEGYLLSTYDRSDIQQAVRSGSDLINQSIGENDDYLGNKVIAVWTEQYNFLMDGKGNVLSEDPTNEIGLIPIVDIYAHKDFEYWTKNGPTDADFTVQFNAALTDLAQVMRMQGFSVAYLAASEDTIPQNIKIGPNFLLKLGINPNNPITPQFGYANPGADIQGGINYIESLLSCYLTSRGLDPSLISSTGKSEKYTSGLDRLLSMVDKFEASKTDIENFIVAEKKLFKIIIRYLNTYSGTELLNYRVAPINEKEADVEIKFAEPMMIKSEPEKLDLIQRRIEMGLISRVEAIMEDRGIKEDAALEVLAKIESQEIEYLKKEMPEQQLEQENGQDNGQDQGPDVEG